MSTFGNYYRVTTFGESHCKGVGCIVDGIPPNLKITEEDIQPQLTRRRPGQSKLTTPRDEADKVTIYSGTERGVTLGTPVMLLVNNRDQRPGDYKEMSQVPRPSHADYTYQIKYGIRASSGGGRSSARETIGRVAAGALAEKWLQQEYGIEIVSFVSSVGDISLDVTTELLNTVSRDLVDERIIRCPDHACSDKMEALVSKLKDDKDSCGGTVMCVIRGVPAGWGEPCFDKMEAKLAHAMLSIPATKAFEIGSGFSGCEMKGSEHNDNFVKPKETPQQNDSSSNDSGHAHQAKKPKLLNTDTNYSGGIQGGISNGMDIYFKVGFKPPATIGKAQKTSDFSGNETVLEAKGRHDPCVVPRAVPIVEAMSAMVIADLALAQIARRNAVANKTRSVTINK